MCSSDLLFFSNHESGSQDFSIFLDELIKTAANNKPRDYYRAMVTLAGFFQMSMKIESDEKRNQAYLADGRPLLSRMSDSIRNELSKLLESDVFQSKAGTQLIKAAKQIVVPLEGSAIEAMILVGSPSIKFDHFAAKEKHICNLTQVIHPDSDLGKSIGMAGIRALSAIFAFGPYLVSPQDEIQSGADKDHKKSKTFPLKTLNLEAIAAIAGRHKMFKEHYGLFIERVINKISNFVGQLLCEGKSNLHILFHESLTQMGRKAYQKVVSKFEALKTKFLGDKNFDNGKLPKSSENPLKKEIKEPYLPKTKDELMGKLLDLSTKIKSEKLKRELQTLLEMTTMDLEFGVINNSYQRLLSRCALG